MPALTQQARQDAVRDVVAGKAACLASLCKTDLRPMNLCIPGAMHMYLDILSQRQESWIHIMRLSLNNS